MVRYCFVKVIIHVNVSFLCKYNLIERLMMQVEHVLVTNQLQVVTKEVVEAARQNLIIGPG